MAYGASLESWLGASPRGFESPILRQVPVLPGLRNANVPTLRVPRFRRDSAIRASHGVISDGSVPRARVTNL